MIASSLTETPELKAMRQELEGLRDTASKKLADLDRIASQYAEKMQEIERAKSAIVTVLPEGLDQEKFFAFFGKPYLVWPQGKNKVLVIVPKFIKGYEFGWLIREDPTFYIYQLDQYSAWLGDVPKSLLDEINFHKEIDGSIEGDTLYYDPANKDAIVKKLREHLSDGTIGENQARIKRGHEFDIIAEMIESGCLPFRPRKVAQEDLRPPKSSIQLREYQKPAINKFWETGAIGVFYPTGAGKSIITLVAMDMVKGPKLLLVPTRTLAEQWAWYIETYCPHVKDEVKISTYAGYRNTGEAYTLTVYDECQYLPADTFSRVAVINTKYRIGLSASPHREDGRESYIFALTGFPVGLNWKEYMETVGRSYHPIHVHIISRSTSKFHKLQQLIDRTKKTFIFCDSIETGKIYAKALEVPFVYGETENRLDIIENNKVVVVSRVADVGVSVKDLERIIEIDFLFGSRQQELQRSGRLMHSEAKNLRHDILMTEKEMAQYGKRIWALREKGFSIRVHE